MVFIISSSLRVMADAPLSFRQTVLLCQPGKRASIDCLPVPRSSLSELRESDHVNRRTFEQGNRWFAPCAARGLNCRVAA